MPRIVEIEKDKKITAGLIKIVKEKYMIPDYVICKKCGIALFYDDNQRKYGHWYGSQEDCPITVGLMDYIDGELARAEQTKPAAPSEDEQK